MTRLIGLLAVISLIWQPALAGAAPDTLGKIKSSQTITIAYSDNSLPFSFTEDGKPSGYSVDLCKEIVDSLKQQLGLEDIKVQWKAANTPERLRMVEKGEADLECGTTSITLDRQEKVDFSNEIFIESGGVLVLADSDMQGLISLGGKKVAVIPGTTTEKRLAKALERKHVNAEMVKIKNAKAGIEALNARKVDAYAGDQLTLAGEVAQSKDPSRYAMLTQQFSIDPYGLALPRGDADFRLAVNRALAKVYREGAIEPIFVGAFGPDAEPSDILKVVFLINAYPD
jgi:glutamate/aspartate transport system substrate-binding protein